MPASHAEAVLIAYAGTALVLVPLAIIILLRARRIAGERADSMARDKTGTPTP